jgi:hypothetical protein
MTVEAALHICVKGRIDGRFGEFSESMLRPGRPQSAYHNMYDLDAERREFFAHTVRQVVQRYLARAIQAMKGHSDFASQSSNVDDGPLSSNDLLWKA